MIVFAFVSLASLSSKFCDLCALYIYMCREIFGCALVRMIVVVYVRLLVRERSDGGNAKFCKNGCAKFSGGPFVHSGTRTSLRTYIIGSCAASVRKVLSAIYTTPTGVGAVV